MLLIRSLIGHQEERCTSGRATANKSRLYRAARSASGPQAPARGLKLTPMLVCTLAVLWGQHAGRVAMPSRPSAVTLLAEPGATRSMPLPVADLPMDGQGILGATLMLTGLCTRMPVA